MRKRLNWFYYFGGGLIPAFALFVLIGVDQSLCLYAREQDLCFREHSLAYSWWKLAIAAAAGFLVAYAFRHGRRLVARGQAVRS